MRKLFMVLALVALTATSVTITNAEPAKRGQSRVIKTTNPDCPYGFNACLRLVTRGGATTQGGTKFCHDRCNQ